MDQKVKWILILAAGCLIGILGVYVILALVFIAILGTIFEFIKAKKGNEINPYTLMEKIKYFSVILAVAVFVSSIIGGRPVVGCLIGIGAILLAATLIHAIRTDVLALDE
jgi:hypothetical protein